MPSCLVNLTILASVDVLFLIAKTERLATSIYQKFTLNLIDLKQVDNILGVFARIKELQSHAVTLLLGLPPDTAKLQMQVLTQRSAQELLVLYSGRSRVLV